MDYSIHMPPPKQIIIITPTIADEARRFLCSIGAQSGQAVPWRIHLDENLEGKTNLDWLFSKSWDGVIVNRFNQAIAKGCVKRGIPCIDINDESPIMPGVPKIRPDNEAMGHMVAEHFKERGYTNFAFCGYAGQVWSEERRAGFSDAAKLLGRNCQFFETSYRDEDKTIHLVKQPDWEHTERARIKEWLKTLPQPVAIMAANDHRATQVIDACQELGIHVPNDAAIVGANDNSVRCELRHPSISSIPVNAKAKAKMIAETLNTLMAGGDAPFVEERIEPLEVVCRQSSDALAIKDPIIAKAAHIIRKQHGTEIDVESLAKQVNSSRSQLERGFRKFLGHSPQAEIRQVQVSYVKELLLTTSLPANEIALLAGFKHPEYMNVVFKKVTGETPGQYRHRISDTA